MFTNILPVTLLSVWLVLSVAPTPALSRDVNKRDGYIWWYWSIDTPTPGPVNNFLAVLLYVNDDC